MKHFTFILLFFAITIQFAFGQSRLSNSSKVLLQEMKLLKTDKLKEYAPMSTKKTMSPVKRVGDSYLVIGIMLTNEEFNIKDLAEIGGKTGASSAGTTTFRVPIESFEQMMDITGIEFIQVDKRVSYKLDKAIADTKADQVHAGSSLPQAFTGAGVVVGVIDIALDMTHPTFRNEEGESRIAAVWMQGDDTGTSPAKYDYGTEITDPTQMLTVGQTSNEESHGTHVASIAAGRGVGPDQMFKGVAPDADIVFVQADFEGGESSILDAIAYIFEYAESQSKPAVVNLSLGHHNGPHDGTTLPDQFMDDIVGVGKVLCGSVSNEGDSPIHIEYTPANDTISTIVPTLFTGGGAEISAWGAVDANFSINIEFGRTDGTIIGETGFFTANQDNEMLFQFENQSINIIMAAAEQNMFNQKPSIMIQIQVEENISEDVLTFMHVTGTSGTIHAWSETTFTSFDNPALIDGDSNYSCNEIGGVADGIISVGAHTTNISYTDINGTEVPGAGMTEGDIAPFSSHGPTIDGRTKPEITAPGDVIVAATNKAFPFLAEAYPTAFLYEENGVTWPFGGGSGTSQSSPMVAGIVALMLEANPNLSAAEVKDILQNTARVDNFTGAIPEGGSQIWGYGKVDALASILVAVDPVATKDLVNQALPAVVFPNPTSDYINIAFEDSHKDVTIQLTDAVGHLVMNKQLGDVNSATEKVDISNLSSGIFYLRITGNNLYQVGRVVKN